MKNISYEQVINRIKEMTTGELDPIREYIDLRLEQDKQERSLRNMKREIAKLDMKFYHVIRTRIKNGLDPITVEED